MRPCRPFTSKTRDTPIVIDIPVAYRCVRDLRVDYLRPRHWRVTHSSASKTLVRDTHSRHTSRMPMCPSPRHYDTRLDASLCPRHWCVTHSRRVRYLDTRLETHLVVECHRHASSMSMCPRHWRVTRTCRHVDTRDLYESRRRHVDAYASKSRRRHVQVSRRIQSKFRDASCSQIRDTPSPSLEMHAPMASTCPSLEMHPVSTILRRD